MRSVFAVAEGTSPTGMSDSTIHDLTQDDAGQSEADQSPAPTLASDLPERIGRYRILSVLGKGGFGVVYLAHDEQLDRIVTLKVPHAKLLSRLNLAELHMAEARTVAHLDHPGIVPVHDVGATEGYPCFIVSKYVEGTDLGNWLKQHQPTYREAAALVAKVAQALHHAHQQGVVHRDVKPGNILIGVDGRPYLLDFGLALREEDTVRGPLKAGTPGYMSPEQACGEGHRVTGRSDLYSLGAVLFKILVGHAPLAETSHSSPTGSSDGEDAISLRRYDKKVPKELERICRKALAKRAADRYASAQEMAEDLEWFINNEAGSRADQHVAAIYPGSSRSTAGSDVSTAAYVSAAVSPHRLSRSPQTISKIVPKGLRAFDARDAGFFLDLLPGPRDREGLPESIRIWKSRIEERDAKQTFSVGLMFGPSGCGKTSMLKAGLLPHLCDDVITIYVEANAEETESQLLRGLRIQFPELDPALSLRESLAALRLGQVMPPEKKLLIVVDQFEQWLHANSTHQEDCPLVQAFRQCDGARLQTLLLIRDDFWMAATRFFQALEIRLREDRNLAAVDQFSQRHAQKVLAEFGRAFGTLPEDINAATRDQRAFLGQAVADLADSGKVICVRLALFAEMMKDKAWTPATLRKAGGAKGVGAVFLEETIGSDSRFPRYARHQKAARAVLEALLPEPGTEIKGKQKSFDELLEASGYKGRAAEFADLIHVLDSELHLITPTEPKAIEPSEGLHDADSPDVKYYQLAHDYLVHSLRDWLARNQMGTRRGRAERLLQDLAAVWNHWPDHRILPSLLQWIQIVVLSEKEKWNDSQKRMMSKATRHHLQRAIALVALLALLTLAGIQIRDEVVRNQNQNHAQRLVDSLFSADIAQVGAIISQMLEYREWTEPLIRRVQESAADDSREKLYASVALVRNDPTHVDYLLERLTNASDPREVLMIRRALIPFRQQLTDQLWQVIEDENQNTPSRRLRAAAALAAFDSESSNWEQHGDAIAQSLVLENPIYLGRWIETFRPVQDFLMQPLAAIYRDHAPERASENAIATTILTDFAAQQPARLTELLLDASEKQFGLVFEKWRMHSEHGIPMLQQFINHDGVPVSHNWEIRFYKWDGDQRFSPPQDWDQVLASPVLDEMQTCDLHLQALPQSPPPPRETVPGEYFASVAVTDVTLGEGDYELSVTFDDGLRIWLDNQLLFENWNANSPVTEAIPLGKPAGNHTIRIEYFQIRGGYVLRAEVQRPERFREATAKRQANAAIALLKMETSPEIWSLLKHRPDPRGRSYLIDRLSALKVDPAILLTRLELETDPSIRRALLLSLGNYPIDDLDPTAAQPWLPRLQQLYLEDADPGIHAALEWLLKSWGQSAWVERMKNKKAADVAWRSEAIETIRQQTAGVGQATTERWFINSLGQTMVVISGGREFAMGSPWTEAGHSIHEVQYMQCLPRTFAVSSTPVTVKQYQQVIADHGSGTPSSETADLSVTDVDWYACAKFCNELSAREGIDKKQWCYEISEEGIRLSPNYLDLEGYRLATESEIEFITRAGSTSCRFYGESDELLDKYAWYIHNSQERLWPVGSLKPNDLGFFDVHGNVWTWCQESFRDYPALAEASEDREDHLDVLPDERRVIRGGSFLKQASNVRSALRGGVTPTLVFNDIGFRVARTLRPPSSQSPTPTDSSVTQASKPSPR